MEPVDLPDPAPNSDQSRDAAHDARDSIRAIHMTSASADTAARGAVAEGGFADRARGFTILIFMAALFVSGVWPAAIFAFLVALLGFQGMLALGPEWWVMIGAGALFPLPPIWIAVITWAKARDLSREARRLAHLADRLLEPDQSAAHEIATVGMAIRREVDSLSSGVESALEKVRSLEGAVAAQAMAIETAASDAELRANHVRSRMEQERKALGDITSSLKTQTEAHTQALSAQTQKVEEVTGTARAALEATTSQLDYQGQAFNRAAEAAVSGSRKASDRMEAQIEALNTVSDNALATTDDLAGRYERHGAELLSVAEGLSSENVRLEGILSRQSELLGNIAELIASQNVRISDAINDSAEHLSGALEATVERARVAARGFTSDIKTVSEGTNAVSDQILVAAGRARDLAEAAGTELSTEATRVLAMMNEQTALAREALGAHFAEFETLYQTRSDELKGLSVREIETWRNGIEAARETARQALKDQSEEARDLITQATDTVSGASETLSSMFERLLAASEMSNLNFDKASLKVDEHMRALPGLAEETTDKIRAVLDEELNAFARLADESARKIRTLHEAYGRHVPAAPRVGGYAEQRGPGILSETRALPETGSTGGSQRKGKWAWGDVLAAVDRPFDKPQDQASSQAPSSASLPDDAESFSRSSLEIFETLQSMAVDLDRALETDPPRDLLRRYLNGEKATFTKRLKEISGDETADRIHDKYLEDSDFRNNVNQYIEQFETLLNEALSNDQDEIMIETFMSSTTGKVYFLLGGAIGHFG